MTDLTDESVKAMLAHYDLPTDCDCDGDDCVKCSHYPTFQERASKQLKDAAPDLARALLDARAERDSIGTMYATVAEENKALEAERDRLRAMLTPPDDLRTYTVDYLVHNDDHGLPGDMPMVPADTVNRLRADAQAAVAVAVEQAAKVPRLHAKQLQQNGLTAMSSDFDRIEEDIRSLAPADGLAAVEALRAEIADLKMNMDADLRTMVREGQQLRTLAAELAAAQQREARLRAALEACVASLERVDTAEGVCCCGDSMDRHSDPMSCGHSPVDMGDYYAGQALESARAALAPTPPADTWHERRTMLPDGDARKGEG